ncbi:pirin family protein [Lishizhenia sp.]|uniref:pirin family protein n=1 Tax=Lishizhenia sp. TaxID=2497594 RepID=UPI00299F2F82|nr:pirin family protein [Lishizhenia sp.]MDX1447120.1 pirin family protein [Lishizhenia sp.]
MKTHSILGAEPLAAPFKTEDPFMFCAYHKDAYPKGNESLGVNKDRLAGHSMGSDFDPQLDFRMYHGSNVPGFPYHPHSGFETVTIAVEGAVDHSDSLGGAGRFMNGDVQWLTAGKGVQHSEMFPLLHTDKDNPFELFQIWLNLPSKSKKVDAHYKMLWSEDIPVVELKDEKGKLAKVKVVAGTLNGTKALDPNPNSWAADPENEIAIWTIKLEAGATFTLPSASKAVNRNIYFHEGTELTIDGQLLNSHARLKLDATQTTTIENGDEEASILLLQGKPIGEPVVQYGPFVANTEQELHETMALYRQTEFGGWPWPMREQVWDKNKGRFAKFADGTEVVK